MEVFVGRFGLPVFRAGPIITALLAIVLSACSGDPGPSADSEQAAAEAKQMLASGGSADGCDDAVPSRRVRPIRRPAKSPSGHPNA